MNKRDLLKLLTTVTGMISDLSVDQLQDVMNEVQQLTETKGAEENQVNREALATFEAKQAEDLAAMQEKLGISIKKSVKTKTAPIPEGHYTNGTDVYTYTPKKKGRKPKWVLGLLQTGYKPSPLT